MGELLGWLLLIALIAAGEAWVYIQCYTAWGYWGVFWGIIAVAIVSAIVKHVITAG